MADSVSANVGGVQSVGLTGLVSSPRKGMPEEGKDLKPGVRSICPPAPQDLGNEYESLPCLVFRFYAFRTLSNLPVRNIEGLLGGTPVSCGPIRINALAKFAIWQSRQTPPLAHMAKNIEDSRRLTRAARPLLWRNTTNLKCAQLVS